MAHGINTKENRKHFEEVENENITCQNVQNAAKPVLGGNVQLEVLIGKKSGPKSTNMNKVNQSKGKK